MVTSILGGGVVPIYQYTVSIISAEDPLEEVETPSRCKGTPFDKLYLIVGLEEIRFTG